MGWFALWIVATDRVCHALANVTSSAEVPGHVKPLKPGAESDAHFSYFERLSGADALRNPRRVFIGHRCGSEPSTSADEAAPGRNWGVGVRGGGCSGLPPPAPFLTFCHTLGDISQPIRKPQLLRNTFSCHQTPRGGGCEGAARSRAVAMATVSQ